MTKTKLNWVLDSFGAHQDHIKDHLVAVEGPHEADRCWSCGSNRRNLQKCHIVPKSLGGPNDPSNIVPLCPHCHDEAPDVKDPEVMWTWIATQQNGLSGLGMGRYEYLWDALPGLVKKYNISTDLECQLALEWMLWLAKNKISAHCGQALHAGAFIKDSTMLWLTEEAVKRAKGIHN